MHQVQLQWTGLKACPSVVRHLKDFLHYQDLSVGLDT